MKKKLLHQFLFVLFYFVAISVNSQPVAVTKTNPTKVYMHYMPWFDAPTNPVAGGTYTWGYHWTFANRNPNIIDANGQREIASNYYPLIGPYASSDPNVIEYHLLLMKLSGIDGVLVDWYGTQGSNGDVADLLNNSNAMINSTAGVGLNFGLIMEDRFWSNISNAQNSLAYASSNYFNKSNYIKGEGNKPLAGVFGPITYTSAGNWSTILASSSQALDFRTLWDNSDAGSNADGQYTWIYNPGSDPLGYLNTYYANRAPSQQYVMGVAYPRYNDYYAQGGVGGSNPAIPDNNGQTLNTTLGYIDQYKTSAHIDYVQCATFNDFGEGTVFEPTVEYGYSDLVRIQQYTGVPYTQSDLQQVYRLFTLRKKYASDQTRQSELNQVFNYFISLQISNAVSLMNTVDGVATAAPVISSATTATATMGTAFTYTITATNTPTSYNATGLPAGLSVNTSTGVISGTPTATGTSSVTISATNTTDTGSATLTLTVSAAPACTGSIIVNTVTPPILDGTIDTNWAKAPVSAITKTVNGTKQPDFSAQWRAMYDNTYLYVLVEVKDATLKAPPYGPNVYDDDAVEIYLDGNNEKATSYDANDHQFGFDYGIAATTANMYGSTTRTGIVYSIPAVSGGYNLAAKIPWTTIGGTAPTNGKLIGFDIDINDNDGGNADKTRQATNTWFSTSNQEFTNASLFGTVPLTVCNSGTTVSAPVISSAAAASGTVGTAFSYTITASNNPTSYGATGLPAGLSVNTTTGVISGTPTTAGTSDVTISAANAGGTGTKTLTITINPAAPVISSAATATGTVGTAFSYTITASNSPTSYGATNLPAGLSVSTTTGIISGTPTTATTSTVTISATNAGGTGTKTLTITINNAIPSAPVISSAATVSGTVGTAFSYTITASNSPTSYGATGLPAGLSVNTTTGVISGTPTTAGTSSVTISATNAGGAGTKTLTITINPAAPVISSATSASGTVGTAFSYTITASNTPTSYNATGLPAGLSVSTTTGVISGTPTTAATSTVTISATNAGGTGTATLTVTISPTQSSASDVVGKITVGYQGWFAAIGDGSPINAWWHYAQNWSQAPSATNNAIIAWPDVRDFTTTFQTGWPNLNNGQPATLFSSFTNQTVNTHFLWMQQNGLDVAALQRFNPNGQEGPTRDSMAAKVKTAAETYGRKFYIMYDVSGWTNMQTEIKTDWTNKMSAYTSSSAYAKQNGKPVVCIWGFGFNDSNHLFTAAVCLDVINWFKSQGCYVIGGVPTYWRTQTNDSRPNFISVYSAFNMISPWMVGRIGNVTDVDNFYTNTNVPDEAYCAANGIDYQPCVLPGDLSQRQRVHGDFMWRQFYDMKRAGAQGLYISMFDEYNEGNQIAKTAESSAFIPAGSPFLTLDEDGTAVSSDYYLRLSGDGTKMFKGTIALTATRPTPYFVTVPETPYLGTAATIPGKILSINYDNGGESIAYHDNDAVNNGGQYRTTEGVDIETSSEGGYDVGWTNAGEWEKYTVNVTTAATYTLQARVASPNTGGVIHVESNGINISGPIRIPNTTGWQTYQTVTVTTSALAIGQQILRVVIDTAGFNIEYLNFIANTAVQAPVISSAATATGTVGTAFSYTITASNSPSSYAASGLPAGLSVNTSTGVISGTPTTAGTSNVTISATNSGGTGTKTLAITISNPSAPVISSAATASGATGTAFSYTITASNSPSSYAASGLPAGLSVNTSTGIISGTPTIAGTYSVTISAINAGGTGTKTLVVTITDGVGIITCNKASGTITIDGNLTENGWNVTRAVTKTVLGTNNNTVTFGVLWDNTYLYVGVKVLDAKLFGNSSSLWNGDAVEIYIDANNNKLTTYDGKDNQIIKAYNVSTVFTQFALSGLQHAWAPIAGGYSVEIAIPWSQLGITAPAAGTTIGFDIANDDDDTGSGRQNQVVWNGTINNYQNTSAFGTLTLSSTVANGPAARVALPFTQQSSSQQKDDIILLPNPVTAGGHFTIQALGWEGKAAITISNFSGSIVQKGEGKIENSQLNIEVPKLATGIYLLQLRNGTQLVAKKFLVK